MVERRVLTVLGATGSIGASALDLVRRQGERFRIKALTAGRNSTRLAALALEFRPEHVAIADLSALADLQERLAGTGIQVHGGHQAIAEVARLAADVTLCAITGMAGLTPTLAAAGRGGIIAIANKESIVTAGGFILAAAAESGAQLLPVDSEHNAIYQAWDDAGAKQVAKITLTASGGPFWGRKRADLADVTPADALRHPNWSMGDKVSVDSATMMNKGLEVIEAAVLFGLPEDRIDVLIQRQSLLHGMVHYSDGSTLAQLGAADMRIPIAHALAWPGRLAWDAPPLDLTAITGLSFETPDDTTFPCLEMARAASRRGGLAPAGLNAANEKAVQFFLEGSIGFLEIDALNAYIMTHYDHPGATSLEAVFDHDTMIRTACDDWLERRQPALQTLKANPQR